MFEDKTYENLLQSVLDNAPDDIDKRQGSIFYDAVSGVILKISKLYTDLEIIFGMTTIATATGDALDTRVAEYGITRLSATKAKYYAVFEGTMPEINERFFTDGLYFTVQNDGKVTYFQAEIAGESQNNIYPDTPAVPVNNIDGLISAKFGKIYENGSDPEDDESLRTRVKEKIAGPAENGNIQHYKTWCESIDGVGKAKIFPLWNGENTVKAVLIDTTGKPLGSAKVEEVQNYIDPADKGMTAVIDGKSYIIGDGLGNGKANIGAHFTATSASMLNVSITFEAELSEGATKESAEQETFESIENYFRELILTADDNENVTVRISAVGAILSQAKNLTDYSNLLLNGNAHNITVSGDFVPVLNEVKIT